MNESGKRKTAARPTDVLGWLGILAAGVALTVVFWRPLWTGGGLVGGDVYSYYLPQKTFYAERLQAGEFPLWNNRTGFGYPLVGESQTGAFYPPTWILYRLLPVTWAYNANHLLHYVLALFFVAAYTRIIGLGWAAALFASVVYVYGWFPPRSCVEWAIIGGAWLPAALVCAERLLRSGGRRWAASLTVVLTLQLLAGHFQLAWITLLTVVLYAAVSLGGRIATEGGWAVWSAAGVLKGCAESSTPPPARGGTPFGPGLASGRWIAVLLSVAVLGAYGLAAIQLLPTWELKQHSQRRAVSSEHDPSFGILPPWYLAQTVVPWRWYTPLVNRDEELGRWSAARGMRTNAVEAHLYLGLVPLVLATWSLVDSIRRREVRRWGWAGMAGLFLVVATGVLMPLIRALPGFNFFAGLGRYTVVTQLAVAVLSAAMVDRLARLRRARALAAAVWGAAVGVTVWSVTSLTGDAAFVARELHVPNPIFPKPGLAAVCVDLVLLASGIGGGVGWWLWFRMSRSGSGGARISIAGTGSSTSDGRAKSEANRRGRLEQRADGRSSEPSATAIQPRWRHWTGIARLLCVAGLFGVTLVDFWVVARLVSYTQLVDDPPIAHLAESPVRQILSRSERAVRLFAPGANFPNVLGVSSVPVYLTFGPAEYVDPALAMPRAKELMETGRLTASQYDWLIRCGVTHVLSFQPIRFVVEGRASHGSGAGEKAGSSSEGAARVREPGRRLRLVWFGHDPLLNRAWARAGQPLFLYEVVGSPGRMRWKWPNETADARFTEYRANQIVASVRLSQRNQLILTDLDYPGWDVFVDGQPVAGQRVDGLFRGVTVSAGEHTVVWKYRPRSLYWGAGVSGATALVLVLLFGLAGRVSVRFSDRSLAGGKVRSDEGSLH